MIVTVNRSQASGILQIAILGSWVCVARQPECELGVLLVTGTVIRDLP